MTCLVSGCLKSACKRGWCEKHYQRWLRHGDPSIITRAAVGEPLRYLLAHMHDGCCKVSWPYATSEGRPWVTDENGYSRSGPNVVCEMVNGPPADGYEVRHKCGKGHLGCFNAGCLEWGSHASNVQDSIDDGTWTHGEQHGGTVLPTRYVTKMRQMRAAGYLLRELAEKFGVSIGHVGHIVNFKSRRNG